MHKIHPIAVSASALVCNLGFDIETVFKKAVDGKSYFSYESPYFSLAPSPLGFVEIPENFCSEIISNKNYSQKDISKIHQFVFHCLQKIHLHLLLLQALLRYILNE